MIPRIIHQTWNTPAIPLHLREFQRSWQKHHPLWKYQLWTHEDNHRLVREQYPEFAEFYGRLPAPLKMDFIRVVYMHSQGGIYADMDFEALRPLDSLLQGSSIMAGREINGIGKQMRGEDYICSALLASPAGHPAWLEVMRLMAAEFRPKRWSEAYSAYVIRNGMALCDQVLVALQKSGGNVVIHSHELFFPAAPTERLIENRRRLAAELGSYAIHHYEASWISPWSKLIYAVMRISQKRRARRPQ
jgi:hypothetical protein